VKEQRLGIGDTLGGRYRIESLLGQGGMGQVFLAEDLKLRGKKWAVKECWRSGLEVESFLEEAEMLAALKHAQLPQLIDYFTPDSDGFAFLVMDYIQGPTLQDLFEENGMELSVPAIVDYAIQLCELLHYLHSFRPKPIIYRDLKPANVMIDENGQIKLIDFGVARHFTPGKNADTVQIGTIGFAAPEQYISAQTDPRSDLYALGAMLFYLLHRGQYAYMAQAPLSELRPDLPAILTDTVLLLLQENPQHRCQSALEVKQRLKTVFPSNTIDKHATASYAEGATGIPNKLIVVGGLYPGVGSTFAAISLARVLHGYGISHAFVEQPTNEPDLYMLLYGDQKAPQSYYFASDVVRSEVAGAGFVHWEQGHTAWVPVNPDGLDGKWTTADSFKLLYTVKKPVVIWDIASNWLDPTVQELCHSADEIIAVVDASPGKINRPSAKKYLEQLLSLHASGRSLHFVANKEAPHGVRKEWLESLPQLPLCTLPELSYDKVMRSVWKGECVQDLPEYLPMLEAAWQPLLRALFPQQPLHHRERKAKSLFSKFIK
jgi:tRNA A-37 threonylcarbamoyl transferase component Bud32